MDIYIQSCGIASDQDFHWRKIEGEGEDKQPKKDPPNFFSTKVKIEKAKEAESQNIIPFTDCFEQKERSVLFLKDYNAKYILLVTELKAIERTKIYGRGVRNFIVIIDTDKDLVQGIYNYVKYNWGAFEKQIDNHIKFNEKNGFIIDKDKFNDLTLKEYLLGLKDKTDFEKQNPSTEIENYKELIAIPQLNWGETNIKKLNKSNNSLIIIAVFLILLVVIVTITLVKKQNQENPSQSQIQKEETCQTMINWHPPCLYLKS
ncbi:hypothetical protein ACN4EE_04120 [Geminocystis sp. CENA526]|uniref:hypothetical protein n=1 Tax=Geminocystis sp. CENA526 TaxID=1355871 RepID=UPI003D701BD1